MANYREGVEWIAYNDEPDTLEPDVIAGYISVHLLAAVFDKDVDRIAADVAAYRRTGFLTGDDRRSAAERTAHEHGYQTAIHGGLRGLNPYRTGKIFGADLHRHWSRGYDEGQAYLARNLRLEVD